MIRNRKSRFLRLGLTGLLLGTILVLGCSSSDPSGGSGFCSGGSVMMLDTGVVLPYCRADAKPTVSITASSLNCPSKQPTAPIVVDCDGGPGDWTSCRFAEFEFKGLGLQSPSNFSGRFSCEGAEDRIAVFDPVSAVGADPVSQTINVSFQVTPP